MDEMNISEMLKKSEEAGDLRRKETLRLVDAGKKLALLIAVSAKKAGIGTYVRFDETQDYNGGSSGKGIGVYESKHDDNPACFWIDNYTIDPYVGDPHWSDYDEKVIASEDPARIQSINRKKWIEVVQNIPALVGKILKVAEKRAKETIESADLAEEWLKKLG